MMTIVRGMWAAAGRGMFAAKPNQGLEKKTYLYLTYKFISKAYISKSWNK